jgi:hypothetical protein
MAPGLEAVIPDTTWALSAPSATEMLSPGVILAGQTGCHAFYGFQETP